MSELGEGRGAVQNREKGAVRKEGGVAKEESCRKWGWGAMEER